MPTFTRLGVTVEVRPVRGERYHWGTPVEDYEPEMLGSIEIASINIGVDEGTPKDLYFQADENDLDDIISSLRAAKKEMAALREYLGLDASSRGETNA